MSVANFLILGSALANVLDVTTPQETLGAAAILMGAVANAKLLGSQGRGQLKNWLQDRKLDPALQSEAIAIFSLALFCLSSSAVNGMSAASERFTGEASAFYERANEVEFIRKIRIAIALDPDNGCALQLSGAYKEDLGDDNGAKKDYLRGLAIGGKCSPDIANNLSRQTNLRQELDGNASTADLMKNVSVLQTALWKVDGQENNNEIASKLLMQLGWTRIHLGQPELAREALKLSVKGGNATTYCLLSKISRGREKRRYARKCLEAIGTGNITPRTVGSPEEDKWRQESVAVLKETSKEETQ
ncbi:MAG: hypothetical protein F6J93_27770 [Oscillatoria sp. SIO1A7]|nr:hypothetical protein [Oscillatoria sp. SIO1A7]